MKERFDYGQNPDKTQGGELIPSYECDYMTDAMRSSCSPKASTRPSRDGNSGGMPMCCAIRSARYLSRERSPRRKQIRRDTKRRCKEQRVSTLFSSQLIQTASSFISSADLFGFFKDTAVTNPLKGSCVCVYDPNSGIHIRRDTTEYISVKN